MSLTSLGNLTPHTMRGESTAIDSGEVDISPRPQNKIIKRKSISVSMNFDKGGKSSCLQNKSNENKSMNEE